MMGITEPQIILSPKGAKFADELSLRVVAMLLLSQQRQLFLSICIRGQVHKGHNFRLGCYGRTRKVLSGGRKKGGKNRMVQKRVMIAF